LLPVRWAGAVALCAMPTSQNRDMGHPMEVVCMIGWKGSGRLWLVEFFGILRSAQDDSVFLAAR
jgi:hypothetical protein